MLVGAFGVGGVTERLVRLGGDHGPLRENAVGGAGTTLRPVRVRGFGPVPIPVLIRVVVDFVQTRVEGSKGAESRARASASLGGELREKIVRLLHRVPGCRQRRANVPVRRRRRRRRKRRGRGRGRRARFSRLARLALGRFCPPRRRVALLGGFPLRGKVEGADVEPPDGRGRGRGRHLHRVRLAGPIRPRPLLLLPRLHLLLLRLHLLLLPFLLLLLRPLLASRGSFVPRLERVIRARRQLTRGFLTSRGVSSSRLGSTHASRFVLVDVVPRQDAILRLHIGNAPEFVAVRLRRLARAPRRRERILVLFLRVRHLVVLGVQRALSLVQRRLLCLLRRGELVRLPPRRRRERLRAAFLRLRALLLRRRRRDLAFRHLVRSLIFRLRVFERLHRLVELFLASALFLRHFHLALRVPLRLTLGEATILRVRRARGTAERSRNVRGDTGRRVAARRVSARRVSAAAARRVSAAAAALPDSRLEGTLKRLSHHVANRVRAVAFRRTARAMLALTVGTLVVGTLVVGTLCGGTLRGGGGVPSSDGGRLAVESQGGLQRVPKHANERGVVSPRGTHAQRARGDVLRG